MHLRRLLLFLAILSLGALSARAQFTWIGGGDPGDITDFGNWSDDSVPGGSSGMENVTFSTASGSQTILIPSSGFALHNITFTNENTSYTFSGESGTPTSPSRIM